MLNLFCTGEKDDNQSSTQIGTNFPSLEPSGISPEVPIKVEVDPEAFVQSPRALSPIDDFLEESFKVENFIISPESSFVKEEVSTASGNFQNIQF